jgi:competence protein ComEC
MNPGGFDLEAWMLERNLRATGYVREVARPRAGQDRSDGGLPGAQADRRDATPQRLDARVLQPGPLVDRLRDDLRAELQARLAGSRYGGVIVALVLGDQRAIAEADWQLFNRTGISHLVSISGLHITMVAGLVALLAGWSWRRSARLLARAPAQTAAAVAGMLTALAYCLLAGWGVPAQRTFFMLAVVALALLSRLALRPTLTLAAAAFFVNLLDPWSALAPGFWLSFGAVAAILYALSSQAGPPQRGWRATLLAAAQVQLAVTVALVPLTVLLFQQVSLVSPLANAVAIPLVSLVVTPMALAGGLAVALPAPLDTLALPLLAIAHALFAWLADGLAWVAAWPWASVPLAAPPGWTLPLAFAGVAWLLAPPGWPARWVGVLWMLPLVLWPPARMSCGSPRSMSGRAARC